jgi:hypothetical protein
MFASLTKGFVIICDTLPGRELIFLNMRQGLDFLNKIDDNMLKEGFRKVKTRELRKAV